MTEERELVMMAVLDGQLSPDVLTLEEVAELQEVLFDAIAEKKMLPLPHNNCFLQ